MASLEIVALDTVTPQLRAPGGADTLQASRSIIMTNGGGDGYYFNDLNWGFAANLGSAYLKLLINGVEPTRFDTSGINTLTRIAFGATPASPDVALARVAAKVVKITDGSTGAGVIQTPAFTVATLPTAATAGAGARSFVTDSTVVAAGNFGAIVAGTGANSVPVYSDATNWRIG